MVFIEDIHTPSIYGTFVMYSIGCIST